MVTAQLLGGACLRAGDVPVAGPPAQRHRIALLTLVVAAWPQPLTRDRAMALLWPERDQAAARRLLNLAVHVLRAALGEHAIASAGDALLFNPSAVRCDLHELRAALAAQDCERVVRAYAGPLLEGFHLPDATDFAYWLDEQRQELLAGYVAALRTVAERQEQSGDAHGFVSTARRLATAEPHSAAATRLLMRALDAAGDRAGAIQCARDYAARMREELELEPDPSVAAFAEQLRDRPPDSVAMSGVPSRIPAVAVLPFVNLAGDSERDYFADGITEDVIAHLSRIRAVKVISLTSVLPFKKRQQSLREIGATLGATAVLDGSVRHSGDRVRIVARLVDVENDRNLWAETYDRQLTDIFLIQTDVALHIAAALKAELSPDEQTRVQKEPTRDLHAYRLFLQGRQLFISFTPESLMRAIELFDRAVARDPTFAQAWAYIAIAQVELSEGGSVPAETAFARATEAARNALRHDPDLGVAHCAMGFLKTVGFYDWAGAEACFRRALQLSPNSADVYDYFSRLCAGVGRFEEALYLAQRAHELDPLAHRADIVSTLLRAGRYDEAIRRAEETVELDATDYRSRATLGWGYFLTGRIDEGIAQLEHVVAALPDNTLWFSQLGEAYGLAGRRADAEAVIRALEERAASSFVSPYHFAYAWTGIDPDRAIDWLERAVDTRSGAANGLKGSFLFARLRTHPRFASLLRKLNLG